MQNVLYLAVGFRGLRRNDLVLQVQFTDNSSLVEVSAVVSSPFPVRTQRDGPLVPSTLDVI